MRLAKNNCRSHKGFWLVVQEWVMCACDHVVPIGYHLNPVFERMWWISSHLGTILILSCSSSTCRPEGSLSSFFYNSCLIRQIQQKEILKKFQDLSRNWTQITWLAVRNLNHYTKLFSVLVWDLNWILIQAWMILSNLSNSSNWTKISSFWKKLDCGDCFWIFIKINTPRFLTDHNVKGFYIDVGNNSDGSSAEHCAYEPNGFKAGETRVYTCPCGMFGQYVRMRYPLEVQNQIEICEVQVQPPGSNILFMKHWGFPKLN